MINIHLINEVDDQLNIDAPIFSEFCTMVFTDQNYKEGEITFIFSNDEFLRKLKQKYFNVDVYTDVISFNLESQGEPLEGEIYISRDRAEENAQLFGITFEDELKRLVIHGSLHLLGHDDKTDNERKKMKQLEDYYLQKFSGSFLD